MARYEGARWNPLREWTPSDIHVKDKFIVHSTGNVRDTPQAIYNYFNQATVEVESNFILGKTPAEGLWQILDSAGHADANVAANDAGISVEVCGSGDEPFTAYQVQQLIELGTWAMFAHPLILPQLIPDPDGHGFGWHVMFGAPGPWTTVRGKVCPGAARIAQLKTTIFPAIFGGPTTEDFLMALTDAEQREILDLARYLSKGREGDLFIHEIPTRVAALVNNPANLAAAIVKAMPAGAAPLSKADITTALREVFAAAGQA